jgi:hypothetical protein
VSLMTLSQRGFKRGFLKRYVSYKEGLSLSCAQEISCAMGLVVS